MNAITITRSNCYEVAVQPNFSTEASTLGLKPGEAPPSSIDSHVGNGMPFRFERIISHEGEIVAWSYCQDVSGVKLTVYND